MTIGGFCTGGFEFGLLTLDTPLQSEDEDRIYVVSISGKASCI